MLRHRERGRYTARRVKNIVILISGRGSNMEAIVRACADEALGCARRRGDQQPRRRGRARVRRARSGIATEFVDHRAFATREAFDAALAERIERHGADVVALAGFMRILGAAFVRRFDGRLVNVHPSLLPAFTGLHTHRRALEAGCKLAGATVHFVTPELDHGPIIAQAVVPVLADDTESARSGTRARAEHALYPRASRWLVAERLEQRGGIVRHRDGAPQLLACRAPSARAGLEEARRDVDRERQDRRVEDEREHRLQQHEAAHRARRDADVGGLRGDGDGEREVEEVGVVGLEALRRSGNARPRSGSGP